MKQAEKDENNRADRERLKARLPELQHRRSELLSKVSAVSLESAMGDGSAAKAEAAAKAEIAQIDGQIATIETAVERLKREYARDEPARQAEARQNARAELEGHSLESLRLAEAVETGASDLAKVVDEYERHRLGTDRDFRKAAGDSDAYARPPRIEDAIFAILKFAGLGRFDRKISDASANGLVAQNGAALRNFAPDHPACMAEQAKADAFAAQEAESRRIRSGLARDLPPWPDAPVVGRRPVRRVLGAEVVEPERIWSGKTPPLAD